MTTATTRKPVTRLVRTGSTPAFQLRVWNVAEWATYTFNDDDLTALATESTTETVRTVITDSSGSITAVQIGDTEYEVTQA